MKNNHKIRDLALALVTLAVLSAVDKKIHPDNNIYYEAPKRRGRKFIRFISNTLFIISFTLFWMFAILAFALVLTGHQDTAFQALELGAIGMIFISAIASLILLLDD